MARVKFNVDDPYTGRMTSQYLDVPEGASSEEIGGLIDRATSSFKQERTALIKPETETPVVSGLFGERTRTSTPSVVSPEEASKQREFLKSAAVAGAGMIPQISLGKAVFTGAGLIRSGLSALSAGTTEKVLRPERPVSEIAGEQATGEAFGYGVGKLFGLGGQTIRAVRGGIPRAVSALRPIPGMIRKAYEEGGTEGLLRLGKEKIIDPFKAKFISPESTEIAKARVALGSPSAREEIERIGETVEKQKEARLAISERAKPAIARYVREATFGGEATKIAERQAWQEAEEQAGSVVVTPTRVFDSIKEHIKDPAIVNSAAPRGTLQNILGRISERIKPEPSILVDKLGRPIGGTAGGVAVKDISLQELVEWRKELGKNINRLEPSAAEISGTGGQYYVAKEVFRKVNDLIEQQGVAGAAYKNAIAASRKDFINDFYEEVLFKKTNINKLNEEVIDLPAALHYMRQSHAGRFYQETMPNEYKAMEDSLRKVLADSNKVVDTILKEAEDLRIKIPDEAKFRVQFIAAAPGTIVKQAMTAHPIKAAINSANWFFQNFLRRVYPKDLLDKALQGAVTPEQRVQVIRDLIKTAQKDIMTREQMIFAGKGAVTVINPITGAITFAWPSIKKGAKAIVKAPVEPKTRLITPAVFRGTEPLREEEEEETYVTR